MLTILFVDDDAGYLKVLFYTFTKELATKLSSHYLQHREPLI